LKDWLLEHKMYGLVLVLIAAFGFYYVSGNHSAAPASNQVQSLDNKLQTNEKKTENTKKTDQEKQPEKMMVDVKGQVKLPGVYLANAGERVNDVINRAGGLTDKADKSQINFAEHVKDEMVINVPAKGEVPAALPNANSSAGGTAVPGNAAQNQAKVNLNKADENGLQTLPGIGPAKAKAIIEYREKNGPFKTIEDLKNISGFGEKTFEKLKDLVEV
jgi:competence protein ComEA